MNLICFFLFFHFFFSDFLAFPHLLLLASVSTMPKRDSSSAALASPRDLRMDSWSHPMSTSCVRCCLFIRSWSTTPLYYSAPRPTPPIYLGNSQCHDAWKRFLVAQTFVFDQPAVTEGNLAWQSFVTAQPHDALLTWTGEVNQTAEKNCFLGLCPVRPMFS